MQNPPLLQISTFPIISTPFLASRKWAYYEWAEYLVFAKSQKNLFERIEIIKVRLKLEIIQGIILKNRVYNFWPDLQKLYWSMSA